MEKIKVVLVGCGGIIRAWIDTDTVRQNVDIIGLCDININNAETAKEKYGLTNAKTGTDLKQMLDELKPEVVFDCTIPLAHGNVTVTALEAGCHVLGEKPMSDNIETAKAMVEAAKKSGKTYAVIQNRRFTSPMRRLVKALRSGAVGTITAVHSDFYMTVDFGATNFRATMPHVLINDMSIHTFDAARMIMNADPVSVFCEEWNPKGSWYERDASAAAIFRMTNNIVYTYTGCWCATGQNTTWECTWRIMGDKGTIIWDGAEGFIYNVIDEEKKIVTVEMPHYDDENMVYQQHGGVIDNFITAIRNNEVPETICTDNIKSLVMVTGAIDSSVNGTKIDIKL